MIDFVQYILRQQKALRSDVLVSFIGYGLLVFTVTLGCLLGAWYQAAESLQADRMDRFGQTIAAQTAALSVESLILNDRVSMGVLASRLNALPEIRGIGIYSIDNQELTRTGSLSKRTFNHQYRHEIELHNSLAGYILVELEAAAFSISFSSILWAPMCISLLVTLLGAIIASLLTHLEDTDTETENPELEMLTDTDVELHQDVDASNCIVALNLFKRTLTSHYPKEKHQQCLNWIKRVANLNSATIEEMSDGSLLLLFSGSASGSSLDEADTDANIDHLCYQAIRSSLLIKQLLHSLSAESGWQGQDDVMDIRFGLHWTPIIPDKHNLDYTILLSAVAMSGNIAASNEFIQQLGDTRHLLASTRKNPVLTALSPSGSSAFQEITDLVNDEREQLDGQTDAIITMAHANIQYHSTSKPSTF
ncbi:MAG: hypothetical protein KUG75_15825 [Pseudomonadales bacterium]|nr:hypothetical protein [Pseudomonadales bacterium]